MPDTPPLAPDDSGLAAQIAAELVIAWQRLGGRADNLPPLTVGAAIYDAFERQGAKSDLLAIIGSPSDTADEKTILKWLRAYNAGQPVIHPV
jgi:hypothetical protein